MISGGGNVQLLKELRPGAGVEQRRTEKYPNNGHDYKACSDR